jgi:hypothetical protein
LLHLPQSPHARVGRARKQAISDISDSISANIYGGAGTSPIWTVTCGGGWHIKGERGLTTTEYGAGVTALGAFRSIQLGHGPRRCARLQRKFSRYPKLNFLRSDVAAHFILSSANKWRISLP